MLLADKLSDKALSEGRNTVQGRHHFVSHGGVQHRDVLLLFLDFLQLVVLREVAKVHHLAVPSVVGELLD